MVRLGEEWVVGGAAGEGRAAHEPGWDALAGRASRASAQQRKIYIEAGRLSAVDVSLTFLPTPYTQDGAHFFPKYDTDSWGAF